MRIFSFNVWGLCYKKQQIIDLINKNNIDIFCLQESHLINLKDLQIIEKTTNSKIYYNSDNNKHGTCIIVKNSPQFRSIQQENSNISSFKNRVTHLIFKTNINIHVINIYAPVSGAHSNSKLERKEFFQNLHKYLEKFNKDEIILCGDFNYVNSNEDRTSGLNYSDKEVLNCIDYNKIKLKDVHHTHNKTSINYTHYHKTKNINYGSRIDRIYVSEDLMTKILSFDYIINDISDHKILKIDIELNRIKWGNGYWKINNAYFLDINYQKKIKKHIR